LAIIYSTEELEAADVHMSMVLPVDFSCILKVQHYYDPDN